MKYFNLKEFDCPCCGLNLSKPILLEKIDKARDISGIPFVLLSSTRCKKHNIEVGGEINSSHLKGLAVDIQAKTSLEKYKIVSSLIKVGCNRIGIYKNFVHGDFDDILPNNVIWRGEY